MLLTTVIQIIQLLTTVVGEFVTPKLSIHGVITSRYMIYWGLQYVLMWGHNTKSQHSETMALIYHWTITNMGYNRAAYLTIVGNSTCMTKGLSASMSSNWTWPFKVSNIMQKEILWQLKTIFLMQLVPEAFERLIHFLPLCLLFEDVQK